MARPYERTHRWIRFELDTGALQAPAWMLFGEARSKCEHIAGVPLEPAVAQSMLQLSLAKGVAATTAIEGNTLSEADVLKRVEGQGVDVPRSKAYQLREVDNIIEALNGVVAKELLNGSLGPVTPERVKLFNALVLKGISLEDSAIAGELRTHSVLVGNIYRGAPAEDCEYLLERLCEWLNGDGFKAPLELEAALRVPYALLKAIVAHVYLAWIHPFADGNGRTARLVEVQILAAAGIPQVACHLLSNHYNETRTEYYRQLREASSSGGNILPFIEYAVQGFVEGLTRHLHLVRGRQWEVAWINYVHAEFRKRKSHDSAAGGRMKSLVLDLAKAPAPGVVPRKALTSLSPQVAELYAGKTDKTLSRDVNELERMGLVVKEPGGVRAAKEILLAFLPMRFVQPASPAPPSAP